MKLHRRSGPQTKNVLIVSASNMGNVGDDIVSRVAGAIFMSTGNFAIKFADLEFHRAEVEWADIVCLGGGGLLYDRDVSGANVDNYLRFLDHARLMGKKTVMLGVGTQGIATNYAKRRYRETLSLVDLVTVRDITDAVTLSEIGVSCPIYTTRDLAFLFPQLLPLMRKEYGYQQSEALRRIIDLKNSGNKQLLGITLSSDGIVSNRTSDIEGALYDQQKISFLKKVVRSNSQYMPVFLTHSRDDVEFYEKICKEKEFTSAKIIRLNDPNECLDILDIHRQFDLVITSRLHSFIMTILAERPVLVPMQDARFDENKIVRLQREFLPSYANNFAKLSEVGKLDVKKLGKLLSVTEMQKNEVNTTIVHANETIEYVKSFLLGSE